MKKILKNLNNSENTLITNQLIDVIKTLEHPNVVKVFDFSETNQNGRFTLTMEVCNLGSLNEILTQGKLSPDFVNKLIIDVLSGLSFIHSKQLVHSDLKLSNILANEDTNSIVFKIGDLVTIKREAEEFRSRGGYYTPEITAPECFITEKVSGKSDVWSFGILLYFIFTGHYPFGDRRNLSYKQVIENVWEYNLIGPSFESIFSPYGELIKMCLDPDPASRPSSCALLHLLELTE
jgi:serine/threonine-protein kinase 24/25/MST4